MKFLIVLMLVHVANAAVVQPSICNKYMYVLGAYAQCSSFNSPTLIQEPLSYLQRVCSYRTAIETCMRNQVNVCTNKQAIMDGISTNLNKCDGNEVQQSLETYFNETYIDITECDLKYNFSSEKSCMNSTGNPFKDLMNISYEQGVVHLQNFKDRITGCYGWFMSLKTIEGCGQRSGYRLLMDATALINIIPFPGIDLYEFFLKLQDLEPVINFLFTQ